MADDDDDVPVDVQDAPDTAPLDTTVPMDEEEKPQPAAARVAQVPQSQADSDEPTDAESQAWIDRIYKRAETITDPIHRQTYINAAIKSAQQTIRMNIAANRQQRLAQKTILDRTLNTINQDTGVGPRTMDEARQIDPDIDNQIAEAKRLDPGIQRHVDAALNHNLAQDNKPTPSRIANRDRLMGVANGSEYQKQQFAGMSLDLEDLTQKDRSHLKDIQTKILNGKYDPTHVQNAMKTLNPLLRELKIQSSNDPHKQGVYNMFTGALAFKLNQMLLDKQPVPSDYEGLRKLAQPLLAQIHEPGYMEGATKSLFGTGFTAFGLDFGGSDRRGFQPTAEDRKQIIDLYKARNNGETPDERTIGYYYQKNLEKQRKSGAH